MTYVIQEAIEHGSHFAICDLITERQKQVYEKLYDSEHDDQQDPEDLVAAGMCYIEWAHGDMAAIDMDSPPFSWPWERHEWKPKESAIENLRVGMALVAAGYDRLHREMGVPF